MALLTDESIMPFGIHKGKKMANVPAKYLLWLWETKKTGKDVGLYIEDNMDALKMLK